MWPDSVLFEQQFVRISFFKILQGLPWGYINPTRLLTSKSDVCKLHIANFNYIKDKIIFPYFMPVASNMLFTGKNLISYLAKTRKNVYCPSAFYIETKEDEWSSKKCLGDPVYLNFKKRVLTKQIRWGFDGNVYGKETFSGMAQSIINSYDFSRPNFAVNKDSSCLCRLSPGVCP